MPNFANPNPKMTSSESTNRANQVQTPRFGRLRQDANPGLALHILQEIHHLTAGWQQQLEQITHDINSTTTAGPTLAAWIESRKFKLNEEGQQIPTPYSQIDPTDFTAIDPEAHYRLCGLDENGELWMRPCPPQEILAVSMAIARYQQLKTLTERQHDLEDKVRKVLETLVHLRMELED
jgi:hypothetical protein